MPCAAVQSSRFERIALFQRVCSGVQLLQEPKAAADPENVGFLREAEAMFGR